MRFFFKDLFLLLFFFYWKGRYTERRDREEGLPSDDSLPKGAQLPILCQEPLPGLPRGCRVPKQWVVLYCFPRPQAGSWKGSGAARIRTGAHIGSWACKARTLTTCATAPGPTKEYYRKNRYSNTFCTLGCGRI